MSIIATAVKHLIAAGVSGDDLVRAIAEMEAAQPVAVDPVAEKRRAYDRERKRNKAKSSGGIPVESAESVEPVSPNEYISNPLPVSPSAKADAPLSDFSDRVMADWNREIAGSPLPPVARMTPARRKSLAARVREHGEDAVLVAIRGMVGSDFHSGRSGKWTEGDFGWLLKPENFAKMLERAERLPAAKPAPAKSGWANGSLFARLQAGEITDEQFHAERARLEREEGRKQKPRPPSEPKPIGALLSQFGGRA